MNPQVTEQTYLIRFDLFERGWSDRTLRHFLGEPDANEPNPFYRSATPMRLYARQRSRDAATVAACPDAERGASLKNELNSALCRISGGDVATAARALSVEERGAYHFGYAAASVKYRGGDETK